MIFLFNTQNLLAPDQPDTDKMHLIISHELIMNLTVALVCNVQEQFEHPYYASFSFYGVDAAGDFIPVKQLREKYNKPRHEVPFGPEDGLGSLSCIFKMDKMVKISETFCRRNYLGYRNENNEYEVCT